MVHDSTSSGKDTAADSDFGDVTARDALTEILRTGAQKMLRAAIDKEVADYINDRSDIVDEDGCRLVVRNGSLPERKIVTGVGPVTVRQPRVRDKRPLNEREAFTPGVLPRYLRKTKSIEEMIPWLYLKGISTNDFPEALQSLLGADARGLSPSTITRLKAAWEDEYDAWNKRSLAGILATHGTHPFYDAEADSIRDIRRIPLQFHGYSISYRRGGQTRDGRPDPKWHAHVAIERRRYLELKAHFLELARHQSADNFALKFYRIPFEPYAPVRRQLLNLHRAVNRTRKRSGFSAVPFDVIPMRRRVTKPF